MNALAVPKSRGANMLEGMFLTGALQAFPTFSAATLLMKLAGADSIVNVPGGAAVFVALTMIIHALASAFIGPKLPRLFRGSYEPLFFDASLTLKDKVSQWLAKPATARQLLTTTIMLGVLAVVAASIV